MIKAVKEAQNAVDLTIDEIIELAKRNSGKKTSDEMEHLVFNSGKQMEKLKEYMTKDHQALFRSQRGRIENHIRQGKTIVFWNTLNGLVYQLY